MNQFWIGGSCRKWRHEPLVEVWFMSSFATWTTDQQLVHVAYDDMNQHLLWFMSQMTTWNTCWGVVHVVKCDMNHFRQNHTISMRTVEWWWPGRLGRHINAYSHTNGVRALGPLFRFFRCCCSRQLVLTRFEDMRFNSILHSILPYVNFAQFWNALGGTLKYVWLDFALCDLIRQIHWILPYVNFAQFRNALGGTLKYVWL